MPNESRSFVVSLKKRAVGVITQTGDYCSFRLADDYVEDPDRPILGLQFENDLSAVHSSALRLPPWFSNLLPEGVLRDWVAADRGVSPEREMELLAQVGHDLPGAVQVVPGGRPEDLDAHSPVISDDTVTEGDGNLGWRFSLAGVALKFSMLEVGDRLTLPAFGEGGDWIVKLPDSRYRQVPVNEFTMMSLARSCGIDVPDIRLVHRDELVGLPDRVWNGNEEFAYAIRRFDRDGKREPVHIEDFAQIKNRYPEDKYQGNYESLASIAYRGRDLSSLQEVARRLAFLISIASGDAHLKNWSLIYDDPRNPRLSPAYDLVSTLPYREAGDGPEALALKFGGSRRFDSVSLQTFDRLERRLRADGANLADVARDVSVRVVQAWEAMEAHVLLDEHLAKSIGDNIRRRAPGLRERAGTGGGG